MIAVFEKDSQSSQSGPMALGLTSMNTFLMSLCHVELQNEELSWVCSLPNNFDWQVISVWEKLLLSVVMQIILGQNIIVC